MTTEKAKDVLSKHAQGSFFVTDLLDLARATLTAAGEPVPAGPTSAPAPSAATGAVDPEDAGTWIAGTDAAGKSVTFAEAVRSGSWAAVKTFTPLGERMRQLNPDLSASAIPAALLAKAAELKIDVPAVLAAARGHLVMGRPADPVEALKGEIALQEAARKHASPSANVRGL